MTKNHSFQRPQARRCPLKTGATLDYVEQGERSGIPVIFLHGLSDSWHSFEQVFPHLPSSIRAIAPTLRGHGDSSHPEMGYCPEDFAADAAAFMDALEIETAVVVGHSLGSTVAQRFAIDNPGRIRALGLMASFFSLPRSAAPQQLWEVVSVMKDPVDPDFVREFQQSTLAQPVPETFFETIVQESLKLPARVWHSAIACMLEEKDDFSPELSRITAPTTLFWGNQDSMVPRSDQDALTAAIAGARLVVYEGNGHAVHWEAPKRFASDLARFASGNTRW